MGVNGRFYQARVTGVQRFAREVARRLPAYADVTVLLPAGATDEDLPPGARVERGSLPGRAWEHAELPFRARALDVVLHPANVAPLWGPAGVLVLHDVLPHTDREAFRGAYAAWARGVGGAAARRSRVVVTVSRWSAEQITYTLRIPGERIAVVPQGTAPLDAPAPAERVAEVRRRFGIEGPYFLSVAGGDPRKGSDFLRALWLEGDGPPGAGLVTVGGTHAAIHPRGGGAGGSPRGHRPGCEPAPHTVLGHVADEDLRALYTGAVALLFPSRGEGFGRPPLEALACGTPAVVAPYGPAREVLGDAADVVPLDPAAWRAAVGALLGEAPEARAVRARRGRERAATFSWDAAAEAVARVCARAAEGRQ
ncbi:MAG: glycoside hydrolase [Gemmatimonadota bacterium]